MLIFLSGDKVSSFVIKPLLLVAASPKMDDAASQSDTTRLCRFGAPQSFVGKSV